MLASLLVKTASVLALVGTAAALPAAAIHEDNAVVRRWEKEGVIAPRVMITTMFSYERDVWIEPLGLTVNFTIPGLSTLYPEVFCKPDLKICLYTTGESEINAATSTTALWLSNKFDLTKTYFHIAGIAGVNPYFGTTGSAMFCQFATQVALEYELDARDMPSNWTTGYWGYGTTQPGKRPTQFYGTELYEINTNLLARVIDLVKDVKLNDSDAAAAYRKQYDYAPANAAPTIVHDHCASLTSDVYFAGVHLSEGFGNYTAQLTNGTGNYCATAQEDNATLESLVRGTLAGKVDFSRAIVLRTASDFDRGPNPTTSGLSPYEAFEADQGGFEIALQNLYLAAWPVIKEIAYDWPAWEAGTPTQSKTAPSFYGNILGDLLE